MQDYNNKGLWNDVQVHLTNHCTLNCIHCYCNSSTKENHWLPISVFSKLIPFLKEDENRVIRLLGGEIITPKKEIFKYLELLNSHKIRPILCTNGYFFKEFAEVTSSFRFKEIILSLYGFKDDHEFISSKKGSFENAIKSLETLITNRICTDSIVINTCITQSNCKNFIDFILYLQNFDIDEIKVLSISNLGRCRTNDIAKTIVNSNDIHEVLKTFINMHPISRKLKIVCEPVHKNSSCRIFKKTMVTIDSKANVYPCHLLIDSQIFPIGNLKNESIHLILTNFSPSKFNFTENGICFAYLKDQEAGTTLNSCPLYLELMTKQSTTNTDKKVCLAYA